VRTVGCVRVTVTVPAQPHGSTIATDARTMVLTCSVLTDFSYPHTWTFSILFVDAGDGRYSIRESVTFCFSVLELVDLNLSFFPPTDRVALLSD
jgi:hypothetical protein